MYCSEARPFSAMKSKNPSRWPPTCGSADTPPVPPRVSARRSTTSKLKVAVSAGEVALAGPILAHEVPPLMRAVKRVAGVRRVSNQLAGIAEAGGVRIGAQRLPYAGAVRGRATLIFRATDASLATDEEEAAPGHTLLRGVLEERLFLGSVYRHYVRVEGETIMVDGTEPVEGGPVTVRVPVAKLQVYAA